MIEVSINDKGTVMIVDDTPGNLAVLSDTLSEAGYRVLVATDGLSALEQMRYIKPDIILLDVMMPGIDGFETCRRLKDAPETAVIPVIFMTGLSELDDLLRGFGEGAQDYLVKPIRPPEVLARIGVHLRQARTVQRVETALQQGEFSALSIDAEARICWLTPTGKQWLDDYVHTLGESALLNLGDKLPLPLVTWVKTQMQNATVQHDQVLEYQHNEGFSAKMAVSAQAGEYLLLLYKSTETWDLSALRDSLGLTFREAEILMWISRGKTNKDIGLILGNSPRTINKHLEHIFEKLGVVTRAAAVTMVLQQRGT